MNKNRNRSRIGQRSKPMKRNIVKSQRTSHQQQSDVLIEIMVFRVGNLVFAKCDGYPPWPGRVIKVLENGIYRIRFIGHPTTAYIIRERLELFNQITSAKYKRQFQDERNANEKRVMKAIELADKKYAAISWNEQTIENDENEKNEKKSEQKNKKDDQSKINQKKSKSEEKNKKDEKSKIHEKKSEKTIQKHKKKNEKEKKGKREISILQPKENSLPQDVTENEKKIQQKQINLKKQDTQLKVNDNLLTKKPKAPQLPIKRYRKKFKLTSYPKPKKNKSPSLKVQLPITEIDLIAETYRLKSLNEQDLRIQVEAALIKLQSTITSIDHIQTPHPFKLTLHAFLLSPNFLSARLIAQSRILQKMILFMKAYQVFASGTGTGTNTNTSTNTNDDIYCCKRQYYLVRGRYNEIKEWWKIQAIKENIQKRRIDIIQDKLQLYKAYPM